MHKHYPTFKSFKFVPGTAWDPSPYGLSTLRPQGIIVHAMAEYLEIGDEDVPAVEFLHRQRLSAHAVVKPSGVVIRTRRDDQGAYHARGFNSTTLGVEVLVPGAHTYGTFIEAIKEPDWVSEAAYDATVRLVRDWMDAHEIEAEAVQRHSDVSQGRKPDPGVGFPWDRFLVDIQR